MELQTPLSLITTSLTILFFLFFLLKLVTKVKRPNTPNLPPGPWKLPLIGNMHHLVGDIPHRVLGKLAKKHGPLMHLQLGEVSAVVVSSPRIAKEFMKTHDLAFADRAKLISTTIITYGNTDVAFAPYGDYWREMRKLCTFELLSAKKVRSFSSIREEESWNLIESIRMSSGSEINLSQKIFSLMNRIFCKVVFGKRCVEQKLLIELLKEIVVLTGGFDVAELFPSLKFLEVLTGLRQKSQKIHEKRDQVLENIMYERITERSVSTMESGVDKEEEDLLDVLLRIKDETREFPITAINVKAIIWDMFSAGTDSSAGTIEWAMSEMIRNPYVMVKAQAELRKLLKGKENIQELDIQKLSYLKLVIKETLRLHPPFPLLLPRECREEREIDRYKIPVKTKIMVNAWAIGRDPEYWEDAESFVPERFESKSNSMTAIGNDFGYLPFGAGRRMCPGVSMGFANVELPLAQLLYHFNWELPNGLKAQDLDMSESNGLSAERKNALCLIPIWHNPV